jgi:DHA2 family multidrug resistance protein
MRNLGSSIGISIVEALLTQNTQVVHSVLGEKLIPYNLAANSAYTANHIDTTTTAGLVNLNNVLTSQANMIAYIDDYQLMMVVTLAVLPLLFLLRVPKKIEPTDHPIVMD